MRGLKVTINNQETKIGVLHGRIIMYLTGYYLLKKDLKFYCSSFAIDYNTQDHPQWEFGELEPGDEVEIEFVGMDVNDLTDPVSLRSNTDKELLDLYEHLKNLRDDWN